MDVANLFGTIKSIKTLFDGYVDSLTKEQLEEIKQQYNNKVIELQSAVMEVQERSLTLIEENNQLKKDLEIQQEVEKRLSNFALVQTDGGSTVYKSKDGDFLVCPTCIENNQNVHYLQPGSNFHGTYVCRCCDSIYQITKSQNDGGSSYHFS